MPHPQAFYPRANVAVGTFCVRPTKRSRLSEHPCLVWRKALPCEVTPNYPKARLCQHLPHVHPAGHWPLPSHWPWASVLAVPTLPASPSPTAVTPALPPPAPCARRLRPPMPIPPQAAVQPATPGPTPSASAARWPIPPSAWVGPS